METPQSSHSCLTRNSTPRLTDRKKKLFLYDSGDDAKDPLYGITPLDDEIGNYSDTKANISVKIDRSQLIHTSKTTKNCKINTPARRSSRLLSKNHNAEINNIKLKNYVFPHAENIKDNILMDRYTKTPDLNEKNLHKLFSTYLCISGKQSVIGSVNHGDATGSNFDNSEINENAYSKTGRVAKKRELIKSNVDDISLINSPKKKKVDNTLKPEVLHIPTKTFYSSNVKSEASPNKKWLSTRMPNNLSLRISRPQRRMPVINMHKSVRHLIRRPARVSSGTIYSSYATEMQVDRILNNVRNDKLRELIESKRRERAQVQKLHEIIRSSQDPIKMARPLTALNGVSDSNNNNAESDKHPSEMWEFDFSDVENGDSNSDISYSDDKPDNEKESIYQQRDPLCCQPIDEQLITRKFFKSGRSTTTCKEIKITDTIKAVIRNGKISLKDNKKLKRKQNQSKKSFDNEFSSEQEVVTEILKNLDDTTPDDEQNEIQIIDEPLNEINKYNNDAILLSKTALASIKFDFNEFRNRIPYNTNDPELIEQQHLLLDFLITNNICTEENFNIFIVDPENHKEDAARIVDEIIEFVDEHAEFRKRVPYQTSDPDLIAHQQNCLDFLINHNSCTEENFNKFIVSSGSRPNEVQKIVDEICNCMPQCLVFTSSDDSRKTEFDGSNKSQLQQYTIDVNMQCVTSNSTVLSNDKIIKSDETPAKLFPLFYPNNFRPLIKKSSRRVNHWLGGHGFNQYQIDAGQKDFGAQQCKQCGLVYSIHEAEEEKLHRDYHASLHLLRFKAWIDEDAVAFYREWGSDGRILRITETSHSKRLERLKDVIKVVDKELGFSSYIIPKIFVAYLAIRRHQIVGLCVVQPLERAHKYVCVNEIDCCTEETFETKCGISRIWVSPLHRHFGIASKLILAVQLNTIVGKEIPLHEIAFSTPTESGKTFAQKICGTTNFLVYQ